MLHTEECSGPCSETRYGATAGATSDQCDGPCSPGHRCPAGSTSDKAQECPGVCARGTVARGAALLVTAVAHPVLVCCWCGCATLRTAIVLRRVVGERNFLRWHLPGTPVAMHALAVAPNLTRCLSLPRVHRLATTARQRPRRARRGSAAERASGAARGVRSRSCAKPATTRSAPRQPLVTRRPCARQATFAPVTAWCVATHARHRSVTVVRAMACTR